MLRTTVGSHLKVERDVKLNDSKNEKKTCNQDGKASGDYITVRKFSANLHVYYLFMCRILVATRKKLDKLQKMFLWVGKKEKNMITLLTWKSFQIQKSSFGATMDNGKKLGSTKQMKVMDAT